MKIFLLSIFSLIFFGANLDIQGQNAANPCQPTAEDILSATNPVKNWNPSFDGILAVGELKSTGNTLSAKEPLSLTQVIAMVGGILKTAQSPIYLIRQSENGTRNKIEIDINKIKRGQEKDINLRKGDILFVSRGCTNGKLLPATKKILPFLQLNPGLVDSPITRKDRIY